MWNAAHAAAQCPAPASCTPGAAPAANAIFGMGIYRVQLGQLDHTTLGGTDGYQNYSCTKTTTLVRQGSYTLTVQTNPNVDENVRAWIDFDNNGVFDPVKELVLLSNDARKHSATFTVPANAVLQQPLRLRIAADNANAPFPTPCSSPEYSQTEDYGVVLTSGTLLPQAAFSTPDSLSCSGLVQWQDRSRNTPTSWEWDFGDGTTSTAQHPQHQYAAPGRYSVRLRVCNATGCDALTKTNYVVVRAAAPRPATCQPRTLAYCCGFGITRLQLLDIDQRSGDGAEGYQDFSCRSQATLTVDQPYQLRLTTGANGHDVRIYLDRNDDGQFSSTELLYEGLGVQSPTIALTVPSLPTGMVYNKVLRLRVVADFASGAAASPCRDVTSGQVEDYGITVLPNTVPPTASIAMHYQQFCGPVRVQFDNTTIGTVTAYQWNFGDGTTSTLAQPPAHTYTQPGTYDVQLTAQNTFGSTTARQTVVVAGACPSYCTPEGYGGTPDIPFYFTRVQLADLDNVAPRAWGVGYRDFTQLTATLQLGKTYELRTESLERTFASADVWAHVVAWIDYNQDGQMGPSELVTPQATNSYSPYRLTFTVPRNARLGATRLRLLIYGQDQLASDSCTPFSFNTSTEDYTVLLLPDAAPPRAGFAVDWPKSCTGTVQFRDQSESVPTAWQWSFGDGTTANEQHPQHTYAAPGTYTVSLRATNRYGSHTTTQTKAVIVTGTAPGVRPAACVPRSGAFTYDYRIAQLKVGNLVYGDTLRAPGYLDNTCTATTIRLAQGQAQPFTLIGQNIYYHTLYMWLDSNDDGEFTPDELLFNSTKEPVMFTRTGTITPPSNAPTGRPLRLRLAYQQQFDYYRQFASQPRPCTRNEEYEMVRDFAVIVDAGAVTATRPSQLSSAAWSIYPNPSTGYVQMQLPTHMAGSHSAEIWDATGRLVQTLPLVVGARGTTEANLSYLPKGIYFLRLAHEALPTQRISLY
ncbi:PKD domain-containing protein [Hymenobacter sp. NBH84]|uniref:PKD domain-containing protein n=1 Tax=Hymenobacter sp. NBH84 TaxID=2596915 RepID=UPI001627369D|nr:GEVED domain-containing protein [Hymenobacter sp. NBH84]QNE40792.1 PKD domain-containing protein [Hymenobacter sp. NBH84]